MNQQIETVLRIMSISGLEDRVFPKSGQTAPALPFAINPLAPASGSRQMSTWPATLHRTAAENGSSHWNTNTSTWRGYGSLGLLHHHLFVGNVLWQRNGADDWNSNSSDEANTRTLEHMYQKQSGLRTNLHHILSLLLEVCWHLVQSQCKAP